MLICAAIIALLPCQAGPNTLSPIEDALGYKLIFDGKTTAGWKGWRKDHVPAGWSVSDGMLTFAPGKEGGDICTTEDYADFELRLEWRIQPGGNSGIFYRASEHKEIPWETAPEMQVLDDERHPDGQNPLSCAGACYAMYPASQKVVRKAGEWNQVRIRAVGKHIEHWLNGTKIVEYEIGSPEWKDRFAKSKYHDLPEYASLAKGRFVLQDHGDQVWYRSIRVRRL